MIDLLPWALRPVKTVHPCKLCTMKLDPGQPRICPVCLERPEAAELLKRPWRYARRWSAGEIKRLRDLWLNTKPVEIAKLLGRPVKSIYETARRLKLPRNARGAGMKKYFWTAEQDELLRQRYNSQKARLDELQSALPMYPRWAIKRRAGKGDYWYIAPVDLRDFIKKHPDEISIRQVDKRFLIKGLI